MNLINELSCQLGDKVYSIHFFEVDCVFIQFYNSMGGLKEFHASLKYPDKNKFNILIDSISARLGKNQTYNDKNPNIIFVRWDTKYGEATLTYDATRNDILFVFTNRKFIFKFK